MQSNNANLNQAIELLSLTDLEKVAAKSASLVTDLTQADSVAIFLWDVDLEGYADRFYFGLHKHDLQKLASELTETIAEEPDSSIQELPLDSALYPRLHPVFSYKLTDGQHLVGILIIAGCPDLSAPEIINRLSSLPLAKALGNAWEHIELRRENERLRNQYEQMEDKTSVLEDQTIKLIHDVTAKDTIRTRQVERERLVYWISNAVRSSVHIQRVLEITVEKIGTTLGVSRCLLLRSVDATNQLQVFEFTQNTVPSVREMFQQEDGIQFTRLALSRTTPQDLADPEHDDQSTYDARFLRKLGIRSGLIVPLVLRETVLGVVFLQDCTESRDWSIDDVSLIGSLADNLSVAIENADLHAERERQATIDGLTGIANRRSFNEMLVREFERARRYDEPLSLIIIDLDHLKKINDSFGHQTGDEAIKSVALTLKQSCRSVDLPARYGGEEFCLLLPNTDIAMAEQLADRLRRLINEADVLNIGKISASLGVANFPLHADDPDLLFRRADESLYEAKQAGRNQIKVALATGASSESPPQSNRDPLHYRSDADAHM